MKNKKVFLTLIPTFFQPHYRINHSLLILPYPFDYNVSSIQWYPIMSVRANELAMALNESLD